MDFLWTRDLCAWSDLIILLMFIKWRQVSMFTAKHFWHYCPPSNPAKIWAIVETEPNNLPNPSPYSQQPQHVPTRPKTTPSPWLDQPTQTTLTLELGTASLLSHQTLEETWYCGMRPNQSASRIYCPKTNSELGFDPAYWNKFFSMACTLWTSDARVQRCWCYCYS